ncbi:hypothetical protein KEJ50_06910 [Candidatus Bathyarchaeota archaeon]|nr:hypothetical protein [Candidatus Bathyarchaeota archaeon]
MVVKRVFAMAILAVTLFFAFFPSVSVGTLKVTIIAKGELKVEAKMVDLKAYSFNWENITNEVNLTFTNKSEDLTVLMPTGNYNKIKFRIVNASINLNGNLTSLEVSQEEYTVEVNFTIKSRLEMKMVIELKYDEEALTQHKLNLITKVFTF